MEGLGGRWARRSAASSSLSSVLLLRVIPSMVAGAGSVTEDQVVSVSGYLRKKTRRKKTRGR